MRPVHSSRRERLYLTDIIEAVDAIAGFIAGVDEARFVQDDLVRSAVLHKLHPTNPTGRRTPARIGAVHDLARHPVLCEAATR